MVQKLGARQRAVTRHPFAYADVPLHRRNGSEEKVQKRFSLGNGHVLGKSVAQSVFRPLKLVSAASTQKAMPYLMISSENS